MTSCWSTATEANSPAAALLAAADAAAVIRGDVSGREGRFIWAEAVCGAPLDEGEQTAALDEIGAALRRIHGDDAASARYPGESSISRENLGDLVEIAWFLAPRLFVGCAVSANAASRYVALWRREAEGAPLARHKDLLRIAICYEMMILRRGRSANSAAFAAKIATETLNRLAIPLFVLRLDREIVRMNAAARAWLRSDGRLRLSSRKLIGSSAVLNAQLRTALARVAGGTSAGVAIMPLVDVSDHRPAVTLSCTPMPEPADHVLVAVQERRCDLNLAQQTLTALGLTQAERRLASFMATGMSLQKAASASGITFSTARSYLKRIFGKLGVARQSDLVGLVAALTPVFLVDGGGHPADSAPEITDEAGSESPATSGRDIVSFRRAGEELRLVLADGGFDALLGETGSDPYR